MKRLPVIAWFAAMAALLFCRQARAQNRAAYEKMVADHARANGVPEALVHRVIVRESKYHPDLIGRGGTIGLMQIKLATARGVGYTGDADGLRDPETNLTYGVKYLAGAWRAAEGNHDRAVHLFASGYYDVAKRQRLARVRHPEEVVASAPPKEPELPKEAAVETEGRPCPNKGSGRRYRRARRGRSRSRPKSRSKSVKPTGGRWPDPRPPCREAKAPCRPPRADADSGKAQGGADALAQSKDIAQEARGCQGAGSAPLSQHGCQPFQRCKRRTAALTAPPHRPTLELFRGELRRGAEIPQALGRPYLKVEPPRPR